MTDRRLNESEVPAPRTTSPDAVTLPPDPRLPAELEPKHDTEPHVTWVELRELDRRITLLSHAVLNPDGLTARRHEEVMRALTTVINGQNDISARLAKLEPTVERHEHALKLVHHGNGAAEPGE